MSNITGGDTRTDLTDVSKGSGGKPPVIDHRLRVAIRRTVLTVIVVAGYLWASTLDYQALMP